MYRKKAIHPLSPEPGSLPEEVKEALWQLFVAVGQQWALGDDPAVYRLRFETFLQNRMDISPVYEQYYNRSADFLNEEIQEHGPESTYRRIFLDTPRISAAGLPSTSLEVLQRFVADEFIALRLALGGFKAFGAINYCGYFGGANIEGEPAPYRVRTSR